MANTSNGWHFERGLDQGFMGKLESLAKERGWFADVLADPELILGIRNNCVDVYWLGQAMFSIGRTGKTGRLTLDAHPKYLINPDLKRRVAFDGSRFKVDEVEPLAETYDGFSTLARMKRATKLYGCEEKDGVHAVTLANSNVIDLEVAFVHDGKKAESKPSTSRIDIACLEESDGSIRLRFWEAKLFSNPELRAKGDKEPPVIRQVNRYRALVEKHRTEIIKSYQLVAQNLAEIGSWGATTGRLGPLIKRVASGEPVIIDDVPIVGLIVYGYDDSQSRWEGPRKKLERYEHTPFSCAGDPKAIRLKHRK
jgi:hypothetical protein